MTDDILIKNKRPIASEPDEINFHKPMRIDNGYKPEYAVLLMDHISKGFSLNIFDVGVSTSTLHSWLRDHEDFALARDRGERRKLKLLEASGIKMAISEGNASVWKVLISQFGVSEKSETRNLHVHQHQKVDSEPNASVDGEEMLKLTGHESRLARIRELSGKLGISAPDSENVDILEGEVHVEAD